VAPQEALARLKQVAALEPFYLARGSAVAFHLGHRVSRDLVLFSADANADLTTLQAAVTRDVPDLTPEHWQDIRSYFMSVDHKR